MLDAINEWIKEILIGAINGNLSTMFGDVNEKVGTIAALRQLVYANGHKLSITK